MVPSEPVCCVVPFSLDMSRASLGILPRILPKLKDCCSLCKDFRLAWQVTVSTILSFPLLSKGAFFVQ